MSLLSIHNHDVIPAQAGIHPEITPRPQGSAAVTISGWTPACAGATPSLGRAICTKGATP